jgi:metal-sulfur cluster biosynthetic enzyme
VGASPDAIVESLRGVFDPCCRERGISVVDMGLIDEVQVSAVGRASVQIVLTSGWCPFQVDLLDQITAAVRTVPGIHDAEVAITLDEAWSSDRLSDDARSKLRSLPAPAEVTDRASYLAAARAAAPPADRAASFDAARATPAVRAASPDAARTPGADDDR